MKTSTQVTRIERPSRPKLLPLLVVMVIGLIAGSAFLVYASTLDGFPILRGYADFLYIPDGDRDRGTDVAPEPTDKAAQSKLWYHDDAWWAVMWNPEVFEYHIYKLNVATQEWTDTGVLVDPREESRSDVLWDEAANKLYIATHMKQENPSNQNTNPDNWAYLQEYHYDAAAGTWIVDANTFAGGTALGSGAIANYIVEAVVIDQDAVGRLWAAYIVRVNETVGGEDIPHYYVTVSYRNAGADSWSAPWIWSDLPEAEVFPDDIAAVVTFTDASGPKVGVLWSNQDPEVGEFFFRIHDATAAPTAEWELDSGFEALKAASPPIPADDHINFATTAQGDLLAIVKTGANEPGVGGPTDVLVGVFAREGDDGSWSWHEVAPVSSFDTRPVILVNEDTDTVYAFTVSSTGGGEICYQDAAIPETLANLAFPPGGCDPADPFSGETLFISDRDRTLVDINNPTSTKQRLTNESGMVVLASNEDKPDYWYVHNMEGGGAPLPPPPATVTPSPDPEPTTHLIYLPIVVSGE